MIDNARDIESAPVPKAEEHKETALEYAAAARELLAEGGERVKDYVTREPVRALGIALGAGVFLGWLIKRR